MSIKHSINLLFPLNVPSKRRLDFAVIGAQKSGTSTLYVNLNAHPQIGMPRATELHYLTRPDFGKNDYDLEKFFDSLDQSAIGEVSPGYLIEDEIPARLHAYNPEMKLIVIIRDPVQRALSAYKMQMLKGSSIESFEDQLASQSHYFEHGMYHRQLMRFVEFFEKERLLILSFDQLAENPRNTFDEICDFLNVDRFDKEYAFIKENQSLAPRGKLIPRMLNFFFNLRNRIDSSFLKPLVRNYWVDRYARKLRNKIYTANLKKGASYQVDAEQEQQKKLYTHFATDLDKLEAEFDLDLSHWHSKYLS